MSEAITLVTVDYPIKSDPGCIAERIVGITPPQAETITEHGVRLDGTEYETELVLEPRVLDHIVDFYQRFRAYENPPQFYNCHLFVTYVLGLTTNFSEWAPGYHWADCQNARPNELRPGQAYGLLDAKGRNMHSILGVNDPHSSLSVYGMRAPLIMSDNYQIRSVYRGRLVRLIAEDLAM